MKKLIVLMFSLISVAVQAQENNAQAPTQSILENKTGAVAPQEAATLLSEKKVLMIDVRSEDEWQQQHIPGTINIPLDQLMGRLTELDAYKEKPIITQCQRGKRSQQALTVLKSLGFAKVYNLDGGIEAWNKAGLAIQ